MNEWGERKQKHGRWESNERERSSGMIHTNPRTWYRHVLRHVQEPQQHMQLLLSPPPPPSSLPPAALPLTLFRFVFRFVFFFRLRHRRCQHDGSRMAMMSNSKATGTNTQKTLPTKRAVAKLIVSRNTRTPPGGAAVALFRAVTTVEVFPIAPPEVPPTPRWGRIRRVVVPFADDEGTTEEETKEETWAEEEEEETAPSRFHDGGRSKGRGSSRLIKSKLCSISPSSRGEDDDDDDEEPP